MYRKTRSLVLFAACACTCALARAQTPLVSAQEAELRPMQTTAQFGRAVAVDGGTAVVGAPNSNAAFVFVRDAQLHSWALEAVLSSPGFFTQTFGWSVAISGDTILVGEHGYPNQLGGAVHVFVRDEDATWSLDDTLAPSGLVLDDGFGYAVSMQGNRAVIGCPGKTVQGQNDAGVVFVYDRDGTGTWQLVTSVLPISQGPGSLTGDSFGSAVAVDGDRFAVGSPHDDGVASDQGSVTVFALQSGTWVPETTAALTHHAPAASDKFGYALALERDLLAVGAPEDNVGPDADQGSVQLFTHLPSVGWAHFQEVLLSSAGSHETLGVSVSVNGGRLAAGAHVRDAEFGLDAGGVFLFEPGAQGFYQEVGHLIPCDPLPGDRFGGAVVIQGDVAVVGARNHQGGAGTAYAFQLSHENFATFGFGDGVANGGPDCPCGNTTLPGLEQGCKNSSGLGGKLYTLGSDSVAADDLILSASNLKPGTFAVLFSGETEANGGLGVPFGDGLRCIGPAFKRLGGVLVGPFGEARWGPQLFATGMWQPGEVRNFQVYSRDPTSPCPPGAQSFNLTNAVRVTFTQ